MSEKGGDSPLTRTRFRAAEPRGERPLRFVLVVLCLAVGGFLPGAAAEPPSTGRIEGTVTVGPELTARRVRFHLYADRGRTAPKPLAPTSVADELANVIVYLESAPPGAAPPNTHADVLRLEQADLLFQPRVLALTKGTTVEFPNNDTVFHNVFSLSKAATFDLGRYPSGSSRSVKFETPGLVKIFCHIHSDMTAIVLVLDNPFFTSPARDGRFALEGIPPGDYRVVAWHERAKLSTRQVRIRAGEATPISFLIPLAESAGGE